jgi:hypothetical protein
MTPWITRILVALLAIAAGVLVGTLLVQLLCTSPLLGYCGGHEHGAVAYLAFWLVSACAFWFPFNRLARRWRLDRLPVIRSE